ncbi:MAG: hypothetical protein WBM86_16830 [Waterburya sp.]
MNPSQSAFDYLPDIANLPLILAEPILRRTDNIISNPMFDFVLSLS